MWRRSSRSNNDANDEHLVSHRVDVANKHGIDCEGNYTVQQPILPLILMPEAGIQMAVNAFELAGARKLTGKHFIAPNYSNVGFQLVVEFNVIPHSEGECNASIIFGDIAAPLKSDGAQSAPNSLFNDDSKFIVVSSFPTNFSDTFTRLIVTSMFGRSNKSLLNDDFQLVVKLISILTSEGARAPSFKLIVGCGYSEISFHFCKNCIIFREGVKDSTIGIVSNNGIVGCINHNGLVGHIGLDPLGHKGLSGVISLGISFIVLGFVGFIGLGFVCFISLCLVSIVGLIDHISLVGIGGFSGISGLIGLVSLVSLIGLIGLVGLISLGKLGVTSLVGSSASSDRRLIGLVGFMICSLSMIAAAAILSVVVVSQAQHILTYY